MPTMQEMVTRLQLSDLVLQKALELERLAKMKMLATVATQAVCVHLAARNAGSLLDKAKLKICIQLSGSTRQAFEKHAATLQSILRISPKFSVRELAVRFGCLDAVDEAQRIKKTFVADFPEARRRQMDCTKAVYTAAALTLAVKELKAKGRKLKLNGAQLRDVCACKPKELGAIMAMMEAAVMRVRVKKEEEEARLAAAEEGAKADAMADMLLATPSQRERALSSKRGRFGKDGLGLGLEGGGGGLDGGSGAAKRRKKSASSKKLDYEAWKKQILAGNGGAVKGRKKKSTTSTSTTSTAGNSKAVASA
eukprot:gene1833-6267_t